MKVIITGEARDDFERLGLVPVTGRSLRHFYWKLVPYQWRPRELFYRLRCWAWSRYTTVRPRTLPYHTWCDRDHLMLHCCFEVLCRFMEDEFDDKVGRNADDPRHARDMALLRQLYRWWKEDYPGLDPNHPETHREENARLHQLINVRCRLWT